MTSKKYFKKAFNNLLSKKTPSDERPLSNYSNYEPELENFAPENFYGHEEQDKIIKSISLDTFESSPVSDENYAEYIAPAKVIESPSTCSIITADAVLTGNIKCNDSIELNGEIYGDLDIAKDLTIFGKVEGNITARTVIMKDGSVINGNLKVNSIIINGVITGNIECETATDFSSKGVLKGNVHTRALSVAEGASIDGQLIMITNK